MLSVFSQFIFGNSSLFGGQHGSGASTWKDKSLCFDLRQPDLELDNGEVLIACFFPIEDIKGNQDEPGLLKVTNLRLIWICCNKKRVNLSIGWRTVSLTFEQNLKDSLGSSLSSLCVLTKYESSKYEFVFNKMPAYSDVWSSEENCTVMQLKRFFKNEKSFVITHLTPMYLDEPFEVVFKIWHCYKRTYLFRHCRSNLTHLVSLDQNSSQTSGAKVGEVNKLPGEETIDVYSNIIQSESRSMKCIGILMLTNIRLIWIDESLPLRNLSIPYIRIDSVKLKQSDRIIINTHDYLATSNQIEFRLPKTTENQIKRTKIMFEQIQNLHTLYKSKPRFGPECCEESLNFMSHLRPIGTYFDSLNGDLARNVENFNPEINSSYMLDESTKIMYPVREKGRGLNGNNLTNSKSAGGERDGDEFADASVEENENDLARYSLKLNYYLNEQPIERDRELVYSPGAIRMEELRFVAVVPGPTENGNNGTD